MENVIKETEIRCPKCDTIHFEPDENNRFLTINGKIKDLHKPHKSHVCHNCKELFQPSTEKTLGFIPKKN
jgi:DNA-directed RNA polymerase subunit RPC12/RpoP